MKKLNLFHSKFSLLLLLLFPMALFMMGCPDDPNSTDNLREVTIKIDPDNSVMWCSYGLPLNGDKPKRIQMSITVWDYDPNTGNSINPQTQTIFTNNSLWGYNNSNQFKFNLDFKPHKVTAICWQDCTDCCNIAGDNCRGQPASAVKNAVEKFFGEQTIASEGNFFNVRVYLLQCDCSYCQ